MILVVDARSDIIAELHHAIGLQFSRIACMSMLRWIISPGITAQWTDV